MSPSRITPRERQLLRVLAQYPTGIRRRELIALIPRGALDTVTRKGLARKETSTVVCIIHLTDKGRQALEEVG
jgi:hypothetical protein